jgi:crossover junction endodeoxyribonuclease RusA
VSLHIVVVGTPRPQGSKDQFGREASKGLPAWRSDIRTAAGELEWDTAAYWEPPVVMSITFRFERPNTHYLPANSRRAARELRLDAPTYPMPRNGSDLDKLVRAVLDALTGLVYRDDSQVVHIETWKQYGERPGADITVSEAP